MDPLHGLLYALILAIFALLHHRFSRFEKMLEQALRKPPEPKAAPVAPALPEQTPIPSTKKPVLPEEDVLEVTHKLVKAVGADFDDEEERTKVFDSRRPGV